MEKEKISEWIARYNEGTLEGADLEAFLRMLKDDPDLWKEVRVDQEINRMLEERDLLEFREAVLKARQDKSSGKTKWLLLAATVLILVSVGGYILYQSLNTGKIKDTGSRVINVGPDTINGEKIRGHKQMDITLDVKRQDSLAARQRVLLAENLVPLQSLESLVGEVTRADGIILEEPAYILNQRQGDTVLFRWKTEESATAELRVFDNKGNKIRSSGKTHGREYLLATESLKQGLYYWKLLKNDHLVTVGKIRIE